MRQKVIQSLLRACAVCSRNLEQSYTKQAGHGVGSSLLCVHKTGKHRRVAEDLPVFGWLASGKHLHKEAFRS